MTDLPPEASDNTSPSHSPREISSEKLFQGDRTIVIIHSGESYRLSITRNDKLILQK